MMGQLNKRARQSLGFQTLYDSSSARRRKIQTLLDDEIGVEEIELTFGYKPCDENEFLFELGRPFWNGSG